MGERNGKFVIEDVEYYMWSEDEKYDDVWINENIDNGGNLCDLEKLKIVIRDSIISNKGGKNSDFYWSSFIVDGVDEGFRGILKSVDSLICYDVRIYVVE